ncbi:MAG: hypothetical protein M0P57_05800 [Syntrophales bacterium]|jgi:hypothetical protein|nr:hypothetical protein [Syntrophales bacterium]MDY0045372.1 hypothetical protein [Syntrophales bacterium]
MESGSVSLIFFFGLFWASVIASVNRYRPFATADFWSDEYRPAAVKRFGISFVLLNLFPVFWLWFLYRFIVPQNSGVLPVLSAALASLSVLGLHRVLHALIASDSTFRCFFQSDEHIDIAKQWQERGVNSFLAHFIPGIAYLLGFAFFAWIMGKFS